MERTSVDIGNEIAEVEKKLRQALKNQEFVDNEELRLSKAILKLRMEKKDIESACSKARHNVKMLNLEIKRLTQEFWQAKNSGL